MRSVLAFSLALAVLSGAAFSWDTAASRWTFEVGWGVRLGENQGQTPEEREYFEQARMGEVYGVNVSAYPWKHVGFGVDFAHFFASVYKANMTFLDQSRGRAEDDFQIVYLAPAVYLRRDVATRLRLLASVGAGWAFYRNETRAGAFPGVQEGLAPVMQATGGFDFFLSRRVAVGGGVRAMHGKLDEVRYNAIPVSPVTISLMRLDFLVGLRFYP